MMQQEMIGMEAAIATNNMEEAATNGGYESNASSFAYDDLFPALPHSQPAVQRPTPQVSNALRVGSSLHTQVFHVPYEERKLDDRNTFGEGESLRTCQAITKETEAHIEISTSKDGSLTFLLTGKHAAVLEARRKILIHFQQQASKQIVIPKEHHRWILGKQWQKLKDLETLTATKISVPTAADNSEIITITGTKEGIEKAEHEIKICSDEQSRKAFERITVPRIYHPFIAGPNNETATELAAETGARIHIPPASSTNEEIVIAGEKNGVLKAKERIEEIYHMMEKKCSTVRVEVPKSQHKYVIGVRGSTIAEILKETGVSVEMPPTSSPASTITLRGPQEKLGPALSKVWERANSVKVATIEAPAWIQKYIIGKNGSNIQKITQDFPLVHVDIIHTEERIKIDGPPEQVEAAEEELRAVVSRLISSLTHTDIPADPRHYKHIIGKSGANINRIKEETGVVIKIVDNEGASYIRIEGEKAGVQAAERELRETLEKLENERLKEVMIDSKYIKTLIGPKGEKIKEIREKFERVLITLPDQGQKRAPVKLRGPSDDVDKCEKYLHKVVKEISEQTDEREVPVFKRFHKHIVGKGGATLRKIREETRTQIELPAEGSASDSITVRGRREDVEDAVKRILALQDELAAIVTETLEVPRKLHNALIGAGGRLVHAITEECGGVRIKFPAPNDVDSAVTVRGPPEDVAKAVAALKAAATEAEAAGHQATVKVPSQHHKFLIGKNGANVKKIRDETGARILFPTDKDEDKETIIIMGKADAVEAARVRLERSASELAEAAEEAMQVAARHHRHFVARAGEVLRRISEACGGVQISFPRRGDPSENVVIKGPRDCVRQAKQMIADIVEDLDAKVTIECIIPQRHHRTVMGARGTKVKEISAEFDVQIKFPEREQEGVEQNENQVDGQNDVIRITGRPEKCEASKEALLQQVPTTIDVSVPQELHKLLSGQRRRDLMQTHDVHILLPNAEDNTDVVKVTGPPANCENAKKALLDKIEELEKEKEEQLLKSFELQFKVDPEYLPQVIGKAGSVIMKIRQDYGVQISLPKKGEENEDVVTIQGYEDKALQAKEAILAIVNQLDSQYKEEVDIDPRLHRRLIGARGKKIREIMSSYKVDIRFPRNANESLVTIAGTEDNVLDAKDYLLNICEEFMQDLTDRMQFRPPPTHSLSDFTASTSGPNGNAGPGFVVRDAPWQRPPGSAPDTASAEEFPSIAPPAATTAAPIWGPQRR